MPEQFDRDEVQAAGAEQPLFIKVPGYKNILQDLEGIRQVLANMREAVEVLRHVEQVKEKSIAVFLENVDRLNQQLADIDQQFPAVGNLELHIDEETPISEADDEVIDNSVRELQDELDGLRSELDRLE